MNFQANLTTNCADIRILEPWSAKLNFCSIVHIHKDITYFVFRYAAVDKIRMIWENSSTNVLSKNQVVLTALAHVFCQYVTLLHDSDHNVAQRAMLQLDLVGEVALQVCDLNRSHLSVSFNCIYYNHNLLYEG